jgi:hypothetical protein
MVPNFFHLSMIEATVFLGIFNAAEMCWYPFPDLCLDTILSTDNSFNLFAWCLLLHALSTVRCFLYRQVCAFPNHVQSIDFTAGGLQSRCMNFSRMLIGNRIHLSSILSHRAKGLNTYVNQVFLFFYTFPKMSKNL